MTTYVIGVVYDGATLKGKETSKMRIAEIIYGLYLRQVRLKRIRKEMKMTRGCCRELDVLLGCVGIDLSNLEMCPMPENVEKKDE